MKKISLINVNNLLLTMLAAVSFDAIALGSPIVGKKQQSGIWLGPVVFVERPVLRLNLECMPAISLMVAKHPNGDEFAYAKPVAISNEGKPCFYPDQEKYAEDIFAIFEHTNSHGGCFNFISIQGESLDASSPATIEYSESYGDPNTRCNGGGSEHLSITDKDGVKHGFQPYWWLSLWQVAQ